MAISNNLYRSALFTGFSVLTWVSGNATVLTADQMFLDPYTVPLAVYPRDQLYPIVIGTTVVGNTIEWNGGITDVDILPMLKPFSASDPAGYPVGYSFSNSDYFYAPTIDYSVDLTAGVATATFEKEGIYHARLTRSDGSTEIRAVLANAGTLGGDQRTQASVPINGPMADLVLVSQPTGGDATLEIANSNAVDDNGASKVSRASSVADAVTKIRDAFMRNGNKKLHLEIVAHGSPGYFELGDTKIGAGGSISIADFQALIDQYVSEISIYACRFTADGGIGLQTLAGSIGRATGFDKFVSVHRSWAGFSRGWDLELGGGLSVAVWEPNTALLLLIGVLMLVIAQASWRQRATVRSRTDTVGVRISWGVSS